MDHRRKQIIVYGHGRNVHRYKFNHSFTDIPTMDIIECPKLGQNATMFSDRSGDMHLIEGYSNNCHWRLNVTFILFCNSWDDVIFHNC